jgi:hypothetical protein
MQRLIAGLIMAVVCASLHAQTLNVRATIPFVFQAGETAMPAGEYTIRHSERTLILHEEGGGPSVVLLTNAERRFPLEPASRFPVEFQPLWRTILPLQRLDAASEAGCEFPKSRAEKELASRTCCESVGTALQRQYLRAPVQTRGPIPNR